MPVGPVHYQGGSVGPMGRKRPVNSFGLALPGIGAELMKCWTKSSYFLSW